VISHTVYVMKQQQHLLSFSTEIISVSLIILKPKFTLLCNCIYLYRKFLWYFWKNYLIKNVVVPYSIPILWITCYPDNRPCRETYQGGLISLWLYKENNKLRDWKNVFTLHIPLWAPHT
jgi:hypothetical protein